MQTRTTVVQLDEHYYIGVQLYSSGQWITLNRLSKPYDTYEEAVQNYLRLSKLGYMDPSLYQYYQVS